MEASSTQKATCEPNMVHFNVIKKNCSLHYKNVKMSFLLPERQNMNEGNGNDHVARDTGTTFQNY